MSFSTRRLKAFALLALCSATLGLGACGRKGSPLPPGPDKHVTYPRTYPAD